MRKIIGVDIDDVLADFSSAFIAFCGEHYGKCVKKEDFTHVDFWRGWGVSREKLVSWLGAFNESYAEERMLPLPGSQEVICQMAECHELHVITSRPLEIAQGTVRWIERHFGKSFLDVHFCTTKGGLVSTRSKKTVCEMLGAKILLDDHPQNADECSSNGIQVYLFDQPWNRHIEQGPQIVRVFSWEDEAIQNLL